jgi:hypothetical protein
MSVEFNPVVYMNEQLNRMMINAAQDLAQRAIEACAERYNFSAEEALRTLGIEQIRVERKVSAKPLEKVPKEKASKALFPMPFDGTKHDGCCNALRLNSGLYTQCTGRVKGDATYCKTCVAQCDKNANGKPDYGTIDERMACGLMEYVDPKGKKPVAFMKVVRKLKLTKEQVEEELVKLNLTVDPVHFEEVEEEAKRGRPKVEKEPKTEGKKGRPKKAKKVLELEGEGEDLLEQLVASATESDTEEKKVKKPKMTEEEKVAEAEKKKAEKEVQRLKDKAEKDKAKLYVLEGKTVEEMVELGVPQKFAEDAVEAEKVRLQKKAEKDAEKKAAKQKAEEEKAAAKQKAEEENKEVNKEENKVEDTTTSEPKEVVETRVEDQGPFAYVKNEAGAKYALRSKTTNNVYTITKDADGDDTNGEVIGTWDLENKCVIKNVKIIEREEEEEEYLN